MIRAWLGTTAAILGLAAAVLYFADDRSTTLLVGTTDVYRAPGNEAVRSFSPPAGLITIETSSERPSTELAVDRSHVARAEVTDGAPDSWQPTVNKDGTAPELARRVTSTAPGDGAARWELVRSLQQELIRTSCYSGPVNGAWTSETRIAMLRLVAIANAQLPTSAPDYVLLSLARGQSGGACEAGATAAATIERTAANTAAANAPAAPLPGRMGMGAALPEAPGVATDAPVSDAPVSGEPKAKPRSSGRSADHLFIHPLGVR